MGWFTVTKVIKGIPYIYRQRSHRDGERVISESVYIGRGDGGGRACNLIVTTDGSRDAQSIPIQVNTTNSRLSFHGARNGFTGPPRTSDDGQLGAGFYVSTRAVAEYFRRHSSKLANYVWRGEKIEPKFDGDLIEFDIRKLKTKTVSNYQELIALGQQLLGFNEDFISSEQLEFLKEKLAEDGYHALAITGDIESDGPELPQLVVFPQAVHMLRKIGIELTLHLKDPKRDDLASI